MIFLVTLLANHCVHNSLQDVFLREHTLHILDKLVSFINIVVLEIVDDQIETSFWNNVNQGW